MNRQWHLVAYPEGLPEPRHFRMVETPVPVPRDGEVLVAVSHLSMDPFPRLRMRADSQVGPPLSLDTLVEGRGVGTVMDSRDPQWTAGDLVAGELGWQDRAVVAGCALTRLDPTLGQPVRHLSLLGPSGLTAWLTIDALAPDAGETIVIAPAAGSVGTIAGQIAKARGARAVGLVASDQQAEFTTGRLGFDAAVRADRAAALPEGVDAFLDGVGGAAHDAIVARLNPHARVVLLGFIAGYNDAQPPRYGSALPILFKRARVQGFLLADHAARFDAARAALAAMAEAGQIDAVEQIWPGLSQAPAAFAALFGGTAMGKQIVRVNEED